MKLNLLVLKITILLNLFQIKRKKKSSDHLIGMMLTNIFQSLKLNQPNHQQNKNLNFMVFQELVWHMKMPDGKLYLDHPIHIKKILNSLKRF